MPVKITKTDGKFKVATPKGTKAKGTTKKKAEKQKRLLNAVEHGWEPTGNKKKETEDKELKTRYPTMFKKRR